MCLIRNTSHNFQSAFLELWHEKLMFQKNEKICGFELNLFLFEAFIIKNNHHVVTMYK